MGFVLMFSPERCNGCQKCVHACAVERGGAFRKEASRTRVFTVKGETGRFSVSMQCQQCDDAKCVDICPTGAMHHGPADSYLVEYDADACIDCRLCAAVCPFGGVQYDEIGHALAKCDTCSGEPKCVAACEHGALEFLETDEVVLARRRAQAELLREAW